MQTCDIALLCRRITEGPDPGQAEVILRRWVDSLQGYDNLLCAWESLALQDSCSCYVLGILARGVVVRQFNVRDTACKLKGYSANRSLLSDMFSVMERGISILKNLMQIKDVDNEWRAPTQQVIKFITVMIKQGLVLGGIEDTNPFAKVYGEILKSSVGILRYKKEPTLDEIIQIRVACEGLAALTVDSRDDGTILSQNDIKQCRRRLEMSILCPMVHEAVLGLRDCLMVIGLEEALLKSKYGKLLISCSLTLIETMFDWLTPAFSKLRGEVEFLPGEGWATVLFGLNPIETAGGGYSPQSLLGVLTLLVERSRGLQENSSFIFSKSLDLLVRYSHIRTRGLGKALLAGQQNSNNVPVDNNPLIQLVIAPLLEALLLQLKSCIALQQGSRSILAGHEVQSLSYAIVQVLINKDTDPTAVLISCRDPIAIFNAPTMLFPILARQATTTGEDCWLSAIENLTKTMAEAGTHIDLNNETWIQGLSNAAAAYAPIFLSEESLLDICVAKEFYDDKEDIIDIEDPIGSDIVELPSTLPHLTLDLIKDMAAVGKLSPLATVNQLVQSLTSVYLKKDNRNRLCWLFAFTYYFIADPVDRGISRSYKIAPPLFLREPQIDGGLATLFDAGLTMLDMHSDPFIRDGPHILENICVVLTTMVLVYFFREYRYGTERFGQFIDKTKSKPRLERLISSFISILANNHQGKKNLQNQIIRCIWAIGSPDTPVAEELWNCSSWEKLIVAVRETVLQQTSFNQLDSKALGALVQCFTRATACVETVGERSPVIRDEILNRLKSVFEWYSPIKEYVMKITQDAKLEFAAIQANTLQPVALKLPNPTVETSLRRSIIVLCSLPSGLPALYRKDGWLWAKDIITEAIPYICRAYVPYAGLQADILLALSVMGKAYLIKEVSQEEQNRLLQAIVFACKSYLECHTGFEKEEDWTPEAVAALTNCLALINLAVFKNKVRDLGLETATTPQIVSLLVRHRDEEDFCSVYLSLLSTLASSDTNGLFERLGPICENIFCVFKDAITGIKKSSFRERAAECITELCKAYLDWKLTNRENHPFEKEIYNLGTCVLIEALSISSGDTRALEYIVGVIADILAVVGAVSINDLVGFFEHVKEVYTSPFIDSNKKEIAIQAYQDGIQPMLQSVKAFTEKGVNIKNYYYQYRVELSQQCRMFLSCCRIGSHSLSLG